MRWPGIEMIYGEFLRKTPVFTTDKRWEDLHTRVIEHVSAVYRSHLMEFNISMLSEYSGGCAILHTDYSHSTDFSS